MIVQVGWYRCMRGNKPPLHKPNCGSHWRRGHRRRTRAVRLLWSRAKMDPAEHNMRATGHGWPMSSGTHLKIFGYLKVHPAMRFADVQPGIQRDLEVGCLKKHNDITQK